MPRTAIAGRLYQPQWLLIQSRQRRCQQLYFQVSIYPCSLPTISLVCARNGGLEGVIFRKPEALANLYGRQPAEPDWSSDGNCGECDADSERPLFSDWAEHYCRGIVQLPRSKEDSTSQGGNQATEPY